jgi:transcriptional regulator with XRE-family HTH domain
MENLKKLRENAGLSQQGLANEIGSTQQKIYSYENDNYEPDIATLKQLANYFETSVDYLIGNTDIRHKIEKVEKNELNIEETDIIEKYRCLSKQKRKSLRLIIDSLLET